MVSEPALSPSEMESLKLILIVSSSYYAKILPLYRKSLEHHGRLRCGRVKNLKGLRVNIYPARCVAATAVTPRAPGSSTFPVLHAYPTPQPNTTSIKRPASPAEPIVEPPRKKVKLRRLTGATAPGIQLLNLVPLLKRLQDSLILPSYIVFSKGRWFLIRQRSPARHDEPPEFPEDLITVKVPPGHNTGRISKW